MDSDYIPRRYTHAQAASSELFGDGDAAMAAAAAADGAEPGSIRNKKKSSSASASGGEKTKSANSLFDEEAAEV